MAAEEQQVNERIDVLLRTIFRAAIGDSLMINDWVLTLDVVGPESGRVIKTVLSPSHSLQSALMLNQWSAIELDHAIRTVIDLTNGEQP